MSVTCKVHSDLIYHQYKEKEGKGKGRMVRRGEKGGEKEEGGTGRIPEKTMTKIKLSYRNVR